MLYLKLFFLKTRTEYVRLCFFDQKLHFFCSICKLLRDQKCDLFYPADLFHISHFALQNSNFFKSQVIFIKYSRMDEKRCTSKLEFVDSQCERVCGDKGGIENAI